MKKFMINQELLYYLLSKNLIIDEEKYQEFEDLLNKEIEKLNGKLIVIDINDILRIMGYDV